MVLEDQMCCLLSWAREQPFIGPTNSGKIAPSKEKLWACEHARYMCACVETDNENDCIIIDAKFSTMRARVYT